MNCIVNKITRDFCARYFKIKPILQSGFWHQFAMTAHSPVGMYPEKFGVLKESETIGTFANNDIIHIDKTGTDHDKFSFGLKKSLFNFMHDICFDFPLQDWFDFKIPRTTVKRDFIQQALNVPPTFNTKSSAKIVWLGGNPDVSVYTKSKKGNTWEMLQLNFQTRKETFEIHFEKEKGEWLVDALTKLNVYASSILSFAELKADFETKFEDFELFWYSKSVQSLRDYGLLVLS